MNNYLPNQYIYNRSLRNRRLQKKHRLVKLIIWLFIIFISGRAVVGAFNLPKHPAIASNTELEMLKEAGESAKQVEVPLPSPTPLKPPLTSIEQDIIDVFGEHADKAFLLLTAKECHENETLNPNAKNNNRDEFGNITSSDYGIFQINNKWQKIHNEAFLFDPAINIRIAWNIYKRDGYSFKLWTCGRQLGI